MSGPKVKEESMSGPKGGSMGQASINTRKQIEGPLPSFGTPELVPVDTLDGMVVPTDRQPVYAAAPEIPLLDVKDIRNNPTSGNRYPPPVFNRPKNGWSNPRDEGFDYKMACWDHLNHDVHGFPSSFEVYMSDGGKADSLWQRRQEGQVKERKTRDIKHWVATGTPLGSTTTIAPSMHHSSSGAQVSAIAAQLPDTRSQTEIPAAERFGASPSTSSLEHKRQTRSSRILRSAAPAEHGSADLPGPGPARSHGDSPGKWKARAKLY